MILGHNIRVLFGSGLSRLGYIQIEFVKVFVTTYNGLALPILLDKANLLVLPRIVRSILS